MKLKKLGFYIILMILLVQVMGVVWASTNSNYSEKTHDNGIYKILLGANPSKGIEVKGGYTSNNDILDIWDYGNASWQKFYFEYNEEGFYKITAFHTGKSLTAKNDNLAEGTEIVQSDYKGLDSQKWILRDSGVNGWIISSLVNPELSISVEQNIINGSQMILSKTKANDNQMFYLYNISNEQETYNDGIYRIAINTNSDKTIQVENSSKENNAKLEIVNYGNRISQKFKLEYQKEGFYKITSLNSGKALTVQNGNLVEGTQIVQSDYKGLASQKWLLRKNNKDSWIISLLSNPNLSITVEGNLENNPRIVLSETKDSTKQTYNILVVDASEGEKQPNGIYKITSAINVNKVVEVKDGNLNENVSININDFDNKNWQKFYFEYQKEGYYKIIATHTGKVLTARDNNLKEGTKIVQADYQNLDSQKWVLRDTSVNGWVISLKSNPELSISINGNIGNGNEMILSKTKDTNNQLFYLFNITDDEKIYKDGIYKIVSYIDDNKTVEVKGGYQNNNDILDIWDYGNVAWQKFYFEYQEEGYYKIVAMHNGKSLTVKDGNLKAGAQIVQYDYQGLDSQKWYIRKDENDALIISPLSNLQLSISCKGSIVNGAELILSNTNYEDNQKFNLYDLSDEQKTKKDGIYKIALGKNPNKVVEVKGGYTNDNDILDIWDYGNVAWQKFYFEYKNGYYKISTMDTGKSLTAKVNNSTGKTEIVQMDYQGLDSQKWLLRDTGVNGWVISLLNNPELSITVDGNLSNGDTLILSSTKNTDNQMFYLYDIPSENQTHTNGTYRIAVGKQPNKSIEIKGGYTSNNDILDIWDYGNANWQKFNFEYQDGYYRIIAMHTGKALTVQNNNIKEGAHIVQADYQGLDSQKWILRDSGVNGWVISLQSNLGLSITVNGTIGNGKEIVLSKTKNNDNQMFYIYNITQNEKTQPTGIYELAIGKQPNKAVEVKGGDEEENAIVDIWEYGDAKWQKFKLEYTGGYYKILACHTGKALTVKNNNLKEGTEIVQSDYKGLDSQKWIVRDSNKNGWIISPLVKMDLAITVKNTIENGSELILEKLQYSDRQMFYCYGVNLGIDIDSSKYPGIYEAVTELISKHPNWQFEILYTGLDFYTAVQGEYDYAGRTANLVHTATYQGDWIAPNPVVNGSWASASYSGIAYFMDPRNILNEIDVFQFVDLADYASSGATWDSIQYQVAGTFLDGYTTDVMAACEATNINPYFVLARLFQEQGYNGSGTINMDGGDGKLYYNPFNISASVGDEVNTALAKAKQEGWDTMQKGLEGGIKVLKEGYIDANQNTLYLNKFDVNPNSPGGFYSHQYMQNLSAAYSEARIFRGAYEDTGTLDNTIKFIIPVYENMPETPSARPSGEGSTTTSETGPISVQVRQTDKGLALRSEPNTTSNLVGDRLPTGTQLISIERLNTGWHKVITLDGRMGYCLGDYLDIIKDINNCNERIMVDSSNGTNVRTGPSTDSNIIQAVGNKTRGTRLIKGIWNADGYWWDLVLFDDGTKGFVVTNWLKVI